MKVLAVVADPAEVRSVLPWAWRFSTVEKGTLVVMRWSYRATADLEAQELELADEDAVVAAVKEVHATLAPDSPPPRLFCVQGPDKTSCTLDGIRKEGFGLVVATRDVNGSDVHDKLATDPLLRRSPCEALIIARDGQPADGTAHVMVTAIDSSNDQAALELVTSATPSDNLRVTLARVEDDAGPEAVELGRRELKRMMRDGGVKASKRIRRLVFTREDGDALVTAAEENDFVFIGFNQHRLLQRLRRHTTRPTLGVIKRAPPLRRLRRSAESRWRTRLSPADYADMTHGLRLGAKLTPDFLVMLGLAAAIASLGLLQDSPAVVIGSMLLAPLMTPMIACGLALAQGNKKLGRQSLFTILIGFLVTLLVSFGIGTVSSGKEITTQIVARGDPNILDLLIALLSAAAAAYALARPSITGAVAGVAIATALVPPLCSAGISFAYREWYNGQGAALLFGTNLVAIVVGAAITFRVLGVTLDEVGRAQKRWVFRVLTIMGVALVVVSFPLQDSLMDLLDEGRAQPTTYPLTKDLDHALVEFIERTPELELVASGRPSALYERADVVLVLSSPLPLKKAYADQLVEICRKEMGNPDLVVEVHCFLNAFEVEEAIEVDVVFDVDLPEGVQLPEDTDADPDSPPEAKADDQ